MCADENDEIDDWYVKPKKKPAKPAQPPKPAARQPLKPPVKSEKPEKPADKDAGKDTGKGTKGPTRLRVEEDDDWNVKPQKKRNWKKGLWWKIPVVLVAILLLLVMLLPTLLGAGPIRHMVMEQANGYVNGHIDVKDWSLGWFGGVSIDGIRILDEKDNEAVSIESVRLPLPLWRAAMMDLNFGEAVIRNVHVRIEVGENGQTNLQRIFVKEGGAAAAAPAASQPAADPKPLPEMAGKLAIEGLAVDVVKMKRDPDTNRMVANGPTVGLLSTSYVRVGIDTVGGKVTDDISLDLGVEKGRAGTIVLKGDTNVFSGRMVKIDQLKGGQKLELQGIELGEFKPILAQLGVKLNLEGSISALLELQAEGPGSAATVKGKVELTRVKASGEMLQGNAYQVPYLGIPVNVSYSADKGGRVVVRDTGLLLGSSGKITVNTELPLPVLEDLQKNVPVRENVDVRLSVDLPDVPGLIAWAPKQAAALPVQLTQGGLKLEAKLALHGDDVSADMQIRVKAIAMAMGEKSVGPLDVDMGVGAHLTPGKPPMEALHDVLVTLVTRGASVEAKVPKLGNTAVEINLDVSELRDVLASLADLGPLYGGQVRIKTTLAGNPATAGEALQANVGVEVSQLDVRAGKRSMKASFPREMALDLTARLDRRADNTPAGVEDGTIKLTVGSPKTPVVSAGMGFSAQMAQGDESGKERWVVKALRSASVKLKQLTVDLAKAQAAAMEYTGGASDVKVTAGTLSLTAGTDLDGSDVSADLKLGVDGVVLDQGGKQVEAPEVRTTLKAGAHVEPGVLRAEVKDLAVKLGEAVQISKYPGKLIFEKTGKKQNAEGGVTLIIDLPQLDLLKRRFTGEGLIPATMSGVALDDGVIHVDVTAQQDSAGGVDATCAVNGDISLKTPGGGVHEQISTELLAKLEDGGIAVEMTLHNRLIDLTVERLKLASGGSTALDQLPSAKVTVTVPDLVAVQKLAGKFAAARQPAPAAVLEQGALKLVVDVQRSGSTTAVNTAADLSKLAISVEGRKYAFARPQTVKVGLEVVTAADTKATDLLGQLESVTLKQLDIDMEAGKLGLLHAVTIDQPAAVLAGPAVKLPEVGIGLDTDLDSVARIGETLLGKARGTLIPARGKAHVEENVSLAGGLIGARGLIALSDFEFVQDQLRFAEKQLELRHDLVWDGGKGALQLNEFALALAGSRALEVGVSGRFGGIGSDVLKVENAQVEIRPDWEKLWPIVWPMLPPDKQKDMADLRIGGKDPFNVNASGMLALGKSPKEMLTGLTVACDLRMKSVNWPSKGVNVDTFVLPVDVAESVVYTKHQTGENPAKTATVNKGTLDVMGLKLEVFEPHPRLSAPANKQIVKGIELNDVLATALASAGGRMFDAKRAQGTVDVTLVSCDRFPLDDLMKSHAKDNDGWVEVSINVVDLDVMSDSLNSTMQLIGFKGSDGPGRVRGNIKDGKARVRDGYATHDITLNLAQFAVVTTGKLDLARNYYEPLNIDLPSAMITAGVDASALPERVNIQLKGPTDKLQWVNKGDILGNVAGDVVGGALKNAAGPIVPAKP